MVTGFTGLHLAEHLLALGDEVLGCSRGGTWNQDAPAQLAGETATFAWDLAEGVSSAAREWVAAFAPDCIYHLAAVSDPKVCGHGEPTGDVAATNVEGTRAILSLAASLRPSPRVLFTSSCYVFGLVSPDGPSVDESAPLDPRGAYGFAKREAESAVLLAARRQQLDRVIARAFQHTDPHQGPNMMLPGWASQLARGGSGPVHARCLESCLDLSDVRDVVGAYRLLVQHGRSASVYNVGSGVRRRSAISLRSFAGCTAAGGPLS